MLMPQEQGNSTNRALVLVLGVLAGVIILGFGGCVGVGLLSWFLAERAEQAALEQAERARAEAEAAAQAQLAAGNAAQAEFIRDSGGDPANAQFTIEVFFEHIREGRLESAYDLTSAAYREQQSRAEFDKWVEAHPGLRRPFHSYGMQPPRIRGEKMLRFRYVAPIRDKLRLEMAIAILRENDLWRIEEIDLREDPAP
jgi:hypothetical protein